MKTIQDKIESFMIGLNKKLTEREEGIVAKMKWEVEGVGVYILTATDHILDKYTIIEDNRGVYFIRTLFY